MSWLPVALLAVPLAGAVLLAVPVGSAARGPTARERWFPRYGLAVSGITLALSAVLAAAFDHDDPARMQFVTNLPWIPGLGLRFHLGVDGVSLPLVLLTALLTFLCFAYLCRGRPAGPAACPPPAARRRLRPEARPRLRPATHPGRRPAVRPSPRTAAARGPWRSHCWSSKWA